ncbi:MAG: BON domain-containing protein [Bdellovibrio sp.]
MKKAILIALLSSGFSTVSLSQTSSTLTSNTSNTSASDTSSMDSSTNKKLSAKDTALIRNIRSQINADKNLSTSAKNITILSSNGKVILKGAVANSQEKAKVEEIAKKTSGTKSVENLTEVGTY